MRNGAREYERLSIKGINVYFGDEALWKAGGGAPTGDAYIYSKGYHLDHAAVRLYARVAGVQFVLKKRSSQVGSQERDGFTVEEVGGSEVGHVRRLLDVYAPEYRRSRILRNARLTQQDDLSLGVSGKEYGEVVALRMSTAWQRLSEQELKRMAFVDADYNVLHEIRNERINACMREA